MSEAEKKKGIKTGALRKAYNDALEKNIVCTVQLLISIASMQYWKEYGFTAEDKLKVARVLKDNGYDADYIQLINPQIDKKYFPTDVQIKKLLKILDGQYHYKDDYIKYSLLKSVNQEELTGKKSPIKKKKRLSAQDLKRYIYETEQIEFVLREIGCHTIKKSLDGKEYRCSNSDGDRVGAIRVKNKPYINVINYTRQKEFSDKADIIDLVKYNMEYDFITAMKYLHSILDLTDEKIEDIDFKIFNDETKENDDEYEEQILIPLDEKDLKQYVELLYIDWVREGIIPLTRKVFDIRYSYRENRIIIPVRKWDDGTLVCIKKRTTNQFWKDLGIPKYTNTEGYNKHLNVYGLWENREIIKETGYAVIYEAEKSVLKRHSRADGTGVALQGHTLSDEQVDILTNIGVDLIVSMDADISIGEVRYLCYMLAEKNKGKVYYTVDNHGLMDAKDSIADLPKKDYDLIFSEKVLFDEDEQNLLKEEMGWK